MIWFTEGELVVVARPRTVSDINVLPVVAADALAVAALPTAASHKDPFGRPIAAQRLRLDLTLVSVDVGVDAHGVRRFG